MLEFKNISLKNIIKEKEDIILDDISFCLPDKGVVVFKGKFNDRQPLLKLLAGFEKPTSGDIILNDKKINYKKPYELTKYRFSNIGLSQRENNFFEMLTVKENYELLNLYSKKITQKDIYNVLDYIKVDSNVLGLKSQALTKAEQQKLALSKPLLLESPIIIVENPLKYLDTKEEVDEISQLLKKISEDRLVLIFTNDESMDQKADGIITLKDKKICSNTLDQVSQAGNILKNTENRVNGVSFIAKTSASLSITNLNYNIWIFILTILGLVFLLLGVQYKTKAVQNSKLRENLINTKNSYAFISTNKNMMKNPLVASNNENLFNRYFFQRSNIDDKKDQLISHDVNSVIEVKDFQKAGFELALGRYPNHDKANLKEILITEKMAKELVSTYTNGEESDYKKLFDYLPTGEISLKLNGDNENRYAIYYICGVIKNTDNEIIDAIYALDGFFYKNIAVRKKFFSNVSGTFNIDEINYTGNNNKIKNRINNYQGILNKAVYYKHKDDIGSVYEGKHKFVNYKNESITKLKDLELADDEIVVSAEFYNMIFNDTEDILKIERRQVDFQNTEGIFPERLLKDVELSLNLATYKVEPNKTLNGFIKSKFKIVGVIYGDKQVSIKQHKDVQFSLIDEEINNAIIFSKNMFIKLTEYMLHPFEYMVNLKNIDDHSFGNYLKNSDGNFMTSNVIRNSIPILNNHKQSKLSITYLSFGIIFFISAIFISVILTKSRFKKRNNLFATFWLGGKTTLEIKLAFAFNNLIMSLVAFFTGIIIAPLFIFFYQRSVIGSFSNIFGVPYKFSAKDFGILLAFSILFTIVNTLINILFMSRKQLKIGKYMYKNNK